MANTLQAKKRVRQNEKARAQNASQRSAMRTAVKKVLKAIEDKDQAAAWEAFRKAESLLDRAARKNLIHINKAARHKSRLTAHIKAMSEETAA